MIYGLIVFRLSHDERTPQYMKLAQICFSFKGRINRSTYWKYSIGAGMFLLILALISGGLIELSKLLESQGLVVLALISVLIFGMCYLLGIYVGLAVGTKRLHDTNRSGWLLLLQFVPVIGIIYLLVVCGFLKGTDGDNKYGHREPKK